MDRGPLDKLLPFALAAVAYALALVQRPGWASSDTKIDLHVDPAGFLGDVAQVWSPTGSLGHVQGGQYGGYLWPMGPFFAALDGLGIPEWVIHRLWLGTLLALAAWGTVRLLDALLGRPRGAAHVVAGALMIANPYVVVFTNRTSVTLLAYAVLPWLLLAVHRGVREPRRFAWPAAFALLVSSTGGGVNAAVTAWLLIGPLLLVLYEPLVAGVPWASVRRFALRAAGATAIASVWWVVPVLVHALYGIDFLRFTEQVGSIWGPTSLPESLRLMGYWPSYLGVGYGDVLQPYFGHSATMLFAPWVVTASLLVPALALAGFFWTRRWRYGPFFVLLAITGLLIMSAGFPEGTPLRKAATFTYNNVDAVQFLRTTYKAAPLVALAVACLGGAAAAALWRRVEGRRLLRPALAVAALGLVAVAALPLVQGRAVDTEVTWKEIPDAWTDTARDLDRELPPNSRAVVLPGQPFAFYRWGATIDPVLPALTERPVAVRNVPPYDDLHAVDLLWTVDNMVQQQRLLPGQLPPLLDLLSAGAVVTATDDRFERSGAIPPAAAVVALRGQPGLERPASAYGPWRRFAAPGETLDPAVLLPAVRRYQRAGARPIVRVEPAGRPLLLDGSAEGVAGLAAFDALPAGRALRYAGDLSGAELRRALDDGGGLVVSDSNRRRAFLASRSRQAVGPTLSAAEELSEDAAVLDPFPERGADAQTVAVYRGARYLRAPSSPQVAQFPEQRPFAAFDGDTKTAWLADPTLDEPRHWVEIGLEAPREIPYVDVLTYNDARAIVTEVEVGGRRFRVRSGWNRLPLGLRGARSLRVAITDQRTGGEGSGSAGGLREVRIPGVRVRELLRPPVRAERALAGRDLSRSSLTYLFSRTTADQPFRRSPAPPPPPLAGDRAEAEAALVRRAQDPETGIDRLLSPPAARAWRADGWATVAPAAGDPQLDRLAGTRLGDGVRAWSSARFQGRPAHRASSAFDGDPKRAWVAPWQRAGSAWLAWETPQPRTLRRLRIERAERPARAPARVRLSWPGGGTRPLEVAADGTVRLPRPATARRFRLDVVAAGRGRAAVAIGELRGAGLPRAAAAAGSGPVAAGCGSLAGSVGGRRLALRVEGTVADFDAGRPLRARGCGAPLRLAAGEQELRLPAATFRPLHLRLRSAAPGAAPPAGGGGRVVDPGDAARGSYEGVRVDVRGPSWLVLGESYNTGWRAECDGRSLGAPQVVDGFANGWRVDRDCRSVTISFAPQAAVWAGYVVGGVACLALLAVCLVGLRRRRAPSAPPPELDAADRVPPLPLRRAAVAGLAIGVACGFAFALRAGVVVAPAATLILWRGVPTRWLVLAAGGLLAVVVPFLYLAFPAEDRGGYNTEYAIEHLGAHWVTVAAVVLMLIALGQTLSTASRRRGGRARGRPAAAAPRARA